MLFEVDVVKNDIHISVVYGLMRYCVVVKQFRDVSIFSWLLFLNGNINTLIYKDVTFEMSDQMLIFGSGDGNISIPFDAHIWFEMIKIVNAY